MRFYLKTAFFGSKKRSFQKKRVTQTRKRENKDFRFGKIFEIGNVVHEKMVFKPKLVSVTDQLSAMILNSRYSFNNLLYYFKHL